MQADTRVGSRVRFVTLCNLLKRIKDARTAKDRKRILSEFMANWREWHKQAHAGEPETSDSMFSALRLLAPELDKSRPAYGMKEKSLAKMYAETLRISEESTEGRRLAGFHLPSAWNAHAGDLAEVVFDVLQNRASAESSSYTLTMINDALDELATGTKEQIRARMLALIHDLSAIEQKFLIRIILKDPGIGLSGKSVLTAYHSDAEQLFAVTQSLERVACTLRDPNTRLREVAIALNVAFQPQLAENCPLRELVTTKLRGLPFLIETKYDGERVQLHKDGMQYRYFSRSGNDWSTSYGESATSSSGSLTRYIHAQFAPHVRNCILDGEMMLFDQRNGRLVTKAETDVDVKHVDDSTAAEGALGVEDEGPEPELELGQAAERKRKSAVQTCFVVFDVLLLNDRVLTSMPLRDRKAELARVVTSLEGRLHVATGQLGSTRADCIKSLNDAVTRGEEGIVVKRLDSVYECAARRAGWFKLKADYVDGMCDELDLLVLGVYFGTGSAGNYRTGSVSHFLVGLRQDAPGALPPPQSGPADDMTQYGGAAFVPLVKVSAGFSARQLRELSTAFASKLRKYAPSEVPPLFRLTDTASGRRLREMPDFWLLPADACVVQVRAAEIMPSGVYPTGFTLRHARARALRRDRSWRDAMSTLEFEQLRVASHGRLVRKELTEADLLRDDAPQDDSTLLAGLDFGGDPDDDAAARSPSKRPCRDDAPSAAPTGPPGRPGRGGRKLQIAAACRGVDSRSIARVSDTFAGLEFCVLLPISSPQKRSATQHNKSEMETLVLAHGGRVVQNASIVSTRYVVAHAAGTLRATYVVQSGAYDVVRPDWLKRCADARHFIEPTPADFVHMRPDTQRRFATLFDRFGDAFTQHVNSPSQLAAVLASVPADQLDATNLTPDDIYSLHQTEIGLLADSDSPNSTASAGLFRPLRFTLPRYWLRVPAPTAVDLAEHHTLELKRRIAICKLQLFGALVDQSDDADDPECSHVVFIQSSSGCLKLRDALDSLVSQLLVAAHDSRTNVARRKVPRVVTARWVHDCIARNELLDERAYFPTR